MVLHWRRCGRAGGCQEQKRKRQIRCREKFIIDTGKDEQQLITANPYSRAVLFMITLVLPVIRGLNESSGFWWLIKHQSKVMNGCVPISRTSSLDRGINADTSKNKKVYGSKLPAPFCFWCARIHRIAHVPWKPHIRNRRSKYLDQDIRGNCYNRKLCNGYTLWRKQSKKIGRRPTRVTLYTCEFWKNTAEAALWSGHLQNVPFCRCHLLRKCLPDFSAAAENKFPAA